MANPVRRPVYRRVLPLAALGLIVAAYFWEGRPVPRPVAADQSKVITVHAKVGAAERVAPPRRPVRHDHHKCRPA